MPTGPPAARLPLPVRRRATWGSPDRLMCEWPECRAGPHPDRDAKINCCRRRGLVRPAVASYLIVLWVRVRVWVRACPAGLRVSVRVCACPGAPRYRHGPSCTRRCWALDSGTDGYHRRGEKHGRSEDGTTYKYGTKPTRTGRKSQGSSPHPHANNKRR